MENEWTENRARGNPRAHHRTCRDHDFLSGDLAFRFALDFHRAAKVELARSLGALSELPMALTSKVFWLAFAGDLGYQFLLSLNPLINFVRRRFGLGYWSLSAYAKRRVKDAVSFIGKFEAAVAHYAERYQVDAVLCGHIHSPAIREFGKVTYYNCGDWVESCSALVEGEDGIISLVNYDPFLASSQRKGVVEQRRAVRKPELPV